MELLQSCAEPSIWYCKKWSACTKRPLTNDCHLPLQWDHMCIMASHITSKQLYCLFNHLLRLISKKTSQFCIASPWWGESSGFPSQRASNAESVSRFPSHRANNAENVSRFPSQRASNAESVSTSWSHHIQNPSWYILLVQTRPLGSADSHLVFISYSSWLRFSKSNCIPRGQKLWPARPHRHRIMHKKPKIMDRYDWWDKTIDHIQKTATCYPPQ